VTPCALKGTKQSHVARRAWVTQIIFLEWYTNYFRPTLLCVCQQNELLAKTVLLLDSAPGQSCKHFCNQTPLDVNVVYMPSNTTSLLQQIDQGVMVTFKACYLHQTFMETMRVLDSSDKTIKHY
jgi:hypothetical protein